MPPIMEDMSLEIMENEEEFMEDMSEDMPHPCPCRPSLTSSCSSCHPYPGTSCLLPSYWASPCRPCSSCCRAWGHQRTSWWRSPC